MRTSSDLFFPRKTAAVPEQKNADFPKNRLFALVRTDLRSKSGIRLPGQRNDGGTSAADVPSVRENHKNSAHVIAGKPLVHFLHANET